MKTPLQLSKLVLRHSCQLIMCLMAFLPADNVFDGIFANGDKNVARSHGDFIYAYEVDSIATNDDLDCDEAIQIIAKELYIDEETAAPIAEAVAYEESLAEFEEHIMPRSCGDCADFGWEMQRLRGVIARKLGFDAVECVDEHGVSHLIVNANIRGSIA